MVEVGFDKRTGKFSNEPAFDSFVMPIPFGADVRRIWLLHKNEGNRMTEFCPALLLSLSLASDFLLPQHERHALSHCATLCFAFTL
jgi:hypothetical protein